MPEPERKIWYYIRNKQFHGLKFRRQYGIGKYVVDFYCPSQKLALEIDGDSHYQQDEVIQDSIRQKYLEQLHIRIIRFTNKEVMNNIHGVLERISAMVENDLP
jgi:very-short-patch-repair endonuclease